MTERLAALLKKAKEGETYWTETASLTFTESLVGLMGKRGVSRAELARRLNTSAAYVTKMLRGNSNFTLRSMVRAARAVGGALHVHVAEEDSLVDFVESPRVSSTTENIGMAKLPRFALLNGMGGADYTSASARDSQKIA